MRFSSLRDPQFDVSVSEAIASGLARDGGLFVPKIWPTITIAKNWRTMPFHEFASVLLEPFFRNDSLAKNLSQICARAFDFPVPIKELESGKAILELFHGPTGAFKDFGARFLALCIDAIPDSRESDRCVLVATSGDTGGAVADAFCTCTKIPVVILYPKNGVSSRQEKQLTVWGQQVQAFAVDGSFDDCQRIVKEALGSPTWQSKYRLISANSINLARLLPQMAYFAYASLKSQQDHAVPFDLVIPSGNMGNASAALWALRLGFPIKKVIFAHNANRAVPNYFETGSWQPQPTISTLANAMDVGDPSNFERVRKLFADDTELKKYASAVSVSDQEIRDTILMAKNRWNEIICPHTATAIFAAQKNSAGRWLAAATAHPAKFESILEPLLGETLEVPASLRTLLEKEGRHSEIPPTLKALEGKLK